MDDHNDVEGEDYEDQVEQMIIENSMMLHSIVNLLLQKGILKQEEIDAQMEKLMDELDEEDEDEE